MKKSTNMFRVFVLVSILLLFPLNNVTGGKSLVEQARDFMDVEMWNNAIEILENVIKKQPKDYDAHLLLGICYVNTDRNDLAIQRFRSAAKGKGYKQKITEECKREGLKHLKSGKIQKARELFEVALEHNPNSRIGIANESYKIALDYLYWQPQIASEIFSLALLYNYELADKICETCYSTGKKMNNRNAVPILHKAKEYCGSKYSEEITSILFKVEDQVLEIGEYRFVLFDKEETAWLKAPGNTTANIKMIDKNDNWAILFTDGTKIEFLKGSVKGQPVEKELATFKVISYEGTQHFLITVRAE